ncbi:MAG: hypothetical protein LBI55_03980, partial [Oscillospiraceae bacterium]|nr:hypothetical protein [Oscillospiraceae bacterium]
SSKASLKSFTFSFIIYQRRSQKILKTKRNANSQKLCVLSNHIHTVVVPQIIQKISIKIDF